MPFSIIRNDITKVAADAIVNTANPQPVIGAGTDSAIYKAAGEELLLAERRKIGAIHPGEAAVTPAFALPAKYIIHTVGPAWRGGEAGEFETLASCYRKSLLLAKQLGCESVAFPLISTGTYGFPKDKALSVAMETIEDFLQDDDLDVTL
ncbi:MAG: macro domain-containing protein, partial [Firmicutes bacterium]|nr:macro domain-containing protein [Bacillota bacterium]